MVSCTARSPNPRILKEMAEEDILAYIQPVFVDLDMNTVEPAIGAQRMKGIYAWKTMLDLGIHTSGGSDAPVVSFDSMENIYFAVTRKKHQRTAGGRVAPFRKADCG